MRKGHDPEEYQAQAREIGYQSTIEKVAGLQAHLEALEPGSEEFARVHKQLLEATSRIPATRLSEAFGDIALRRSAQAAHELVTNEELNKKEEQ